MPEAGDIYFCDRVKDDATSRHHRVVLYADVDQVLYVTATSRVHKFMYAISTLGKPLESLGQHPASAVFLAIQDIKGSDKKQFFNKPTLLDCYNSFNEISKPNFDSREVQGLLKKRGQLPNKYLAKIIPCACGGGWSDDEIGAVLDKQNGIGRHVGDFYSQWGRGWVGVVAR